MSDAESDESTCLLGGGHREKSETFQEQLAYVEEVFAELFKLMEQYAPAWYTEKHYSRAVIALRVLKQSRQFAKATAARSQSTGAR
jgi:hypothetical protein